MKPFFTTLIIFFCLSLQAQENKGTAPDHKGFYLSMGLGPVFGGIDFKTNESGIPSQQKWTGTGAIFDLKIGGTLKENLILHGTIISNSLPGPKIETNSGSGKATNNLNIGEAMIGGGLTYYFMPSNIFLSGSLGLGNYTLLNTDTDTNISTDRGLGMQLKVGKEWWVSKRWGLGVAASYGKTSVNNKIGNGVTEKLNSNRFGIMFSASLN